VEMLLIIGPEPCSRS